jgi:hypothetical protein
MAGVSQTVVSLLEVGADEKITRALAQAELTRQERQPEEAI